MDAESGSKIVPEIYYDFIARLLPGCLLVICITPLRSLIFSWSDTIGQIGSLCMLLGAGYIAGLVLSAPAVLIDIILFLMFSWVLRWMAGVKLNLPVSPLRACEDVPVH